MVFNKSYTMLTDKYIQFIPINALIEQSVIESKIKEGMVTVLSRHTTAGILVNEPLECLESDIDSFLNKLAPEDNSYSHARMLRDYGSTAGNPTGHLKALITGNHCHYFIHDGKVDHGGAQEAFFCEFDGPSERTIDIQIIGI